MQLVAPVLPVPTEGAVTIDTCQQLLMNALTDAGIIGIDEAPDQPVLNRAFSQVNWLLAQWARKRWLCYRLQDYSFVSTGAPTYTVGNNQTVNINPRPDRIDYAFLRFLNTNNGQQPNNAVYVDIPLRVIPSHEDYARITVKQIGTLAWEIFYDPSWPVGVLRPWPVPQATIYEIHVGIKVILPRFTSLQQQINLPPEYEIALNWCLVRRLRATYQMPPDPTIDSLARDALNTMRIGNMAMPTLRLPGFLRNRQRGYDYRGDNAGDQ